MKKILLLALMLSLFLVLSVGANAALTVSSVSLGSTSQERNRNVSQSVTLTITNTENDNVTINSITPSADAKFKLNITNLPASTVVANGTSASVTVTFDALITKDLDSVDSTGVAKAIQVGTFTVSGTKASGSSITSSSATVTMQAENRLKIRKGKVKITSSDGSTREKTVNDGTKVTNVRPGDNLRFEFTIENKFSGNGEFDLDMDDVDVSLETSDSSNYDFDEETDSVSVNADDEDVATFTVDVEDDADRGTDSFTLVATGKDDNGALHGERIKFDLEVERETHDLVFRRADLTPATLLCQGSRSIQVNANVLNRGRDDENRAGVELSVPSFNVLEKKADVDLDQDDDASFTFTFQVPKDAKAGTYEVRLTSIYDFTVKNNVKTLALTVEDCKKDETPPPVVQPPVVIVQQPQNNTVTQPPKAVTNDATTNVPRARVKESTFFESNEYLMILGAGVAVVLVLLLALVAVAFRRR